jgi:hypothetical protein
LFSTSRSERVSRDTCFVGMRTPLRIVREPAFYANAPERDRLFTAERA